MRTAVISTNAVQCQCQYLPSRPCTALIQYPRKIGKTRMSLLLLLCNTPSVALKDQKAWGRLIYDLLKRRAPAENECGSGGTPSKIRRPFVCMAPKRLGYFERRVHTSDGKTNSKPLAGSHSNLMRCCCQTCKQDTLNALYHIGSSCC